MISTWLRVAIYFVVFVLLQVLVMNNLHLLRVVTPFVYVYVILKLPVNLTRSEVIFTSFLLGLTVDVFSNTFGLHAAACSFVGFVRKPLLDHFVNIREVPDESIPSYHLFGYARFIRYALALVALHHVVLFVVEAFSFFQPLLMLTRMTSSLFFSLLLILTIEAFNLKKRE
jgi:rod shape-determining protein MreD